MTPRRRRILCAEPNEDTCYLITTLFTRQGHEVVSASSIRETLRIINRFFRLRTCTDHVLANRKRPCLLHQIGRCPAPCVYPVPPEEYRRSVDEVVMFLEGKANELVEGLRLRMKRAAGDQLCWRNSGLSPVRTTPP